jgi:hypothetical protein
MNRKRAFSLKYRALLLLLCTGFTACASFGSGGQFSGDDAEISARGAVGRLEAAVAGPMFEGDGGSEIRLAVLSPQARGDAPDYLPLYVQGLLNNNFKKYSAITLIDRQNLDRIIAEQDLAANGRYTDADYVKIGNLSNAQYLLIGAIQKLSGDQYALQLSVSDSSTGERKADFMQSGTLRQIEGNGALINEASADLLTQLGVRLTAEGRQSLMTGNTAVVRSETGLARGITAQASGASVEALFNYTQSIAFDPSQIEALARLNVLSSTISDGSISQRIMNDLQARDRWIEAFRAATRFFSEHPPFEITFDPNLIQEGATNYARRTANLAMRVALDPSEAGFAALNAMISGLESTGQRSAWGFNGWPLLDLQPKTPGTVVFAGKQTFSFKLDVTLLNESRKVLGKGSHIFSGRLRFAAGDRKVDPPAGEFGMVRFTNVKADDLTPILTIVISAVNGIPSSTLNAVGYMRIDTGDLEQKIAARPTPGPAAAVRTAAPPTPAPQTTQAPRPIPVPAPSPAPTPPTTPPPRPVPVPVPSPAPTPQSGTFKIGDRGPGGGVVFSVRGNTHMEVSEPLGNYNWNRAITAVRDYKGGGYSDWRLPAQDELNLVYQNLRKNNLGNMGDDWHWSSSEYSSSYMWGQRFSDGVQSGGSKSTTGSVRAVRAF